MKPQFPFPFFHRDCIHVIGLCWIWERAELFRLFTDSFAITVHHQHRMHVCLWTPFFRADLAGATYTGQSAGQCLAFVRLSALPSFAIISPRCHFGADKTHTHISQVYCYLFSLIVLYTWYILMIQKSEGADKKKQV